MSYLYFKNVFDLQDIKQTYKTLAKIHHPDMGGDVEVMQKINAEYSQLINSFSFNTDAEKQNELLYADLINELLKLNGLVIELIGTWLWVSGNTKEHKEKLKELKFFWSKNKAMWYYRKEFSKCSNFKPWSIEKIREHHSSRVFSMNNQLY